MTLNPLERKRKATEYFYEGYNCAQAVALAFEDLLGMDRKSLLRMVSSMGGGMGRLREVCGGVSVMFLVFGAVCGYDDPTDLDLKAAHYARIQELAARFKERNKTLICRELLGETGKNTTPVPDKRTKEYYDSRPCPRLVGECAEILAEYLNSCVF